MGSVSTIGADRRAPSKSSEPSIGKSFSENATLKLMADERALQSWNEKLAMLRSQDAEKKPGHVSGIS